MRWIRTGCPYCGVGCGLTVASDGRRVVKVKGDADHPSSRGEVCMKAVCLPPTVDAPGRARQAFVRDPAQGGLRPVSPERALDHAASELRRIRALHGPDAVAFYASGQLLTEDYYVLVKLVKGFLGTDNLDTNSRLCMASAVAAYRRAFGADGPPGCYSDLDEAEVVLVVGANPAACHPVLFRRLERRRKAAPDRVRVIAVDPRRTETADLADLHLALRPGTDVALLNAMLHVAIDEGRLDKDFIAAHTEGFEAVRRAVEPWDAAATAELCGVPEAAIRDAARAFAGSRRGMVLWSMGANQSTRGTDKNHAILNLCLATGNVGRPGAGPFSLTGQPNAMGGREVGGLTGSLPGYRTLDSAADRRDVAAAWGVPRAHLPSRRGRTATEMIRALEDGALRAIWIVATNPAASMPDLDRVERALRRAELVVVQDAYFPTDTARFADVFLPAATWPEKDGTMTNSERYVTRVRKVVSPPGDARPDWRILCGLAARLGWEREFAYRDEREVFDELRRLTADRPCDLSGITWARLESGPLQWPCPTQDHAGTMRRYLDRRFPTPSGRARFVAVEPRPPADRTTRDYPLVLLTGRLKPHWHTRTRTRWSRNLERRAPEPVLDIHPDDARSADVSDGDFASVQSRRGEVAVLVRSTAEVPAGTVFLAFHWGRADGRFKAANNLTHDARDADSGQPELKYSAVRVRRLSVLGDAP